MDTPFIIGLIGTTLVLVAFFFAQVHRWRDDFLLYDSFNFIGALFLLYYAASLNSIPFTISSTAWAILSLRDIYIDLRRDGAKIRRTFFGHHPHPSQLAKAINKFLPF